MEGDISATPILSVPCAEVYKTLGQGKSLITKGPLNVLYIASFSCFVLQVNDFSYHLSKEIPVLVSPSKDKNGYPSYVFPNVEGYFVVRIVQIRNTENLSGFETVLNNHCELAYEVEAEVEQGGSRVEVEKEKAIKCPNEAIALSPKEKTTKTDVATEILYKGGELAKKGLIASAQVLSKGIVMAGEYAQKKFVKKEEGKDLNESTVTKVKILNTTTEAVFKMTQVQIQGIITVGKEIAKEVARKASKTETGQKFENYKHKDTVMKVGKSTLNAVANIFVGMYEAAAIIGRGVETTATKMVTHKYGEKAGKATQEGFDAAGNIGKIAEVVAIEGSKAVQAETEQRQKQKGGF